MDLKFIHQAAENAAGNQTFQTAYLAASFSDGSCLRLNFDSAQSLDSTNLSFTKPRLDHSRPLTLSLRAEASNSTSVLFRFFIGSDRAIYLTYTLADTGASGCLQLPGHFDDVLFIKWQNAARQRSYPYSILLAGFDKGLISYYLVQVDVDRGQFRHFKVNEELVHYEKITFSFLKDHMIMTAGADCSLKIAVVDLSLDRTEIGFNRNETDFSKLSVCGPDEVVTHSEGGVSVWGLSTCQVRAEIAAEGEIRDHVVLEGGEKLVVVSRDCVSHLLTGYQLKRSGVSTEKAIQIKMYRLGSFLKSGFSLAHLVFTNRK